MKKLSILLLAFSVFVSISCKTEVKTNQNAAENPKPLETGKSIVTENGVYSIDLKTNPTEVKAGEETNYTFEVKSPKNETVRNFEIVHEKPMHVLIVSDDLEEFYHVHPDLQTDGKFTGKFTFPNGGNYTVYTDFTLKGLPQSVQNFAVKVSGKERAKVELKPDEKFEKTVEGLRFVMKPNGELIAGNQLMLDYDIYDSSNKPVTDLENYLGAKAHFVIISKDLQEFVHAHPMSADNVKAEEKPHGDNHDHGDKMANMANISTVSAHIAFPKGSIYKIWAQFQRGGKVITVPFTVDVKPGSKEKEIDTSKVNIPEGAFKVVVSSAGFAPEEITFKKGQPLKLAFYRADKDNCADEVVFKDLNIKQKLPVGEVTLIDIPTDKAGEFNFACGMNMFKGKVIVQ
ncbi:MAG TPA: cupredoxin domain-containing protein [Pyrinomonadaceae bacterium]|nr:cupredoxin domain-containing protein [Pyrinomonadaceae bacterium]